MTTKPTQATKNNSFTEFIYGSIGGLVGQTLCHPLDTIKTRYQKWGNKYDLIRDYRTAGLRTFYRGLPSPRMSVILEKSVLFGSYDLFKKYGIGGRNPFWNGIQAGLMTTAIVVPFERVKVLRQLSKNENSSTFKTATAMIRREGLPGLYRGWTPTLLREVPGYGLYFSTYESIKTMRGGKLAPWEAFMTGSACGIVAWTFIYPSDPVKTWIQKENVTATQAIKTIYANNGIRGFYQGFKWGIARASVLHGGVFFGYEMIRKIMN